MILQTPTPNIENSLDFYKKLKFQTIKSNDDQFVTDGKAIIKVNPDRYARAGILLYRSDWDKLIPEFQKLVPVFEIKDGHVMADSTGTWIYMLNGGMPFLESGGDCFSSLGNYAGVSLETVSMSHSSSLWKLLGYKVTMGGPDEGWMVMGDEKGNSISFMHPNSCPHLFFNPSLTYFNGKNNPKVIQSIRDADIPLAEEITFFNKEGEVDNVIVRDPGGFGFFIFNDG